MKKPLIIAHRGSSANAPENTMESIRMAFEEHEADMVEMDVRVTRDGVPVVFHDGTIDRTTDGKGALRNYTFKELQRFDAGYYFDPAGDHTYPFRKRGVSVPSLKQVMEKFPDRPFIVEVKESDAFGITCILDSLEKIERSSFYLLGAIPGSVGRRLRKNLPPGASSFLGRDEVICARIFFQFGLPQKKFQTRYISMPTKQHGFWLGDRAWIDFVHRLGAEVYYWTVNDPGEIQTLVRNGADGLITDFPEKTRFLSDI